MSLISLNSFILCKVIFSSIGKILWWRTLLSYIVICMAIDMTLWGGTQIAKSMGLTWVPSAPDRPMLAPWTLLSEQCIDRNSKNLHMNLLVHSDPTTSNVNLLCSGDAIWNQRPRSSLFRYKIEWNLNQNTILIFYENVFEKVLCKMSANIIVPQWVKNTKNNPAGCRFL